MGSHSFGPVEHVHHCGASATTRGGGQPLHPIYDPDGGLGLGRFTCSLVIAAAMVILIAVTSLRKRATTVERLA